MGASVQRVGLCGLPSAEERGLIGWDRERYGTLLPDFAVPTATHVGESTGAGVDLAGSSIPFTPERLLDLYPDQAKYVERYNRSVDEGLAKAFLLEEDARRLRAQAAEAPVP